MSKYFIRNAKEGAKATYKKKQMFKTISRSEFSNLIDFNYGEKRLYGRVDRYFQPIVPNNTYLEMVNLKLDSPAPVSTFNFVADAFADLQNKFKIKSTSGEISRDEKYLTDIIPISAYQDPKAIFNKYMDSFSIAVGNIITDKDLQFTNFAEFVNVIFPYMQNYLKNKVITYPAFVKSKQCPMSANGLVIEIGRLDPNDDKAKYDDFYKSKNWDFFLNACNTYGFMVDCNMPNRIIADINSVNMIEKMRAYNPEINSADVLITNCYDTVAGTYFDTFKIFLYNIYSDNRPKTIVTTVNNKYDGTRTAIKKIKNYSYEDFVFEVGESKLLDLYLTIRFMEEESTFSHYEKKIIIRDTISLTKINGYQAAIDVFEKLLNKTFDYSGSISYIEQRNDKSRR